MTKPKTLLAIVTALILAVTLGVGLIMSHKPEQPSAKDTRPLKEKVTDVVPQGSTIDVQEKPETNSATVSISFPEDLPDSEIPAAVEKLDDFKKAELNRQKDTFSVVSTKADFRVQMNTYGDNGSLSELWSAFEKQRPNIDGKFAVASMGYKTITLNDNQKSRSTSEAAEKLISYSEHAANSGILSDFPKVTVSVGNIGDAVSVDITSPADIDKIRTYAGFVDNPNYPLNGPKVEIKESNLKVYGGSKLTPEQRAYLESWPHGEVKFY